MKLFESEQVYRS